MPQALGQLLTVIILAQRRTISWMIKDFLDEVLHRLTGLEPKVLGDPGLLQPGLVDEIRDRNDAVRLAQRKNETVRVRHVPIALPG